MTKQKILVIGTGGTIGAKAGSTITADAPLKILNLYTPPAGVELIGRAAFDRFSEHADLAYLEQLCTYMQGIDYSAYRGVVLLHGSDTLTYTAALLAHLLPDKPLVLVAAGTPPEAPGSNALPNLDLAVQYLLAAPKTVCKLPTTDCIRPGPPPRRTATIGSTTHRCPLCRSRLRRSTGAAFCKSRPTRA